MLNFSKMYKVCLNLNDMTNCQYLAYSGDNFDNFEEIIILYLGNEFYLVFGWRI